MEQEKPLLELIAEKEAQLKEKCDLVCTEAETIISKARKDSALILEKAEKEGKVAADALYQNEMKILDEEIARIKHDGERQLEEIKLTGEKNLSRVAERIVQVITG